MDCSLPTSFDIFQIYDQYCGIMSGSFLSGREGYRPEDDLQKMLMSREALSELLKVVESRVATRISILEEIYKLMSRLDMMGDYSEFSRFYDFVFFICRENGQKRITVSRAVMAWRLVLAGRFRLLNEWCSFVEKNQRHNISEDTWRQVLAFSRCVHENLEGYDPEGAWPVLIDEFVEHMYSIRGSSEPTSLSCRCDDSETQQFDGSASKSLHGLENFPGFKRKWITNSEQEHNTPTWANATSNYKRRHVCFPENGNATDKNQSGCATSPCAVEGCLSKGFAGLFSSSSCLQFNH